MEPIPNIPNDSGPLRAHSDTMPQEYKISPCFFSYAPSRVNDPVEAALNLSKDVLSR